MTDTPRRPRPKKTRAEARQSTLPPTPLPLDALFPNSSRVLLTGSGKQFIERIGVDAARTAVLGVLVGENIRDQTEPLTQQRIAQISGGLISLFAQGFANNEHFSDELSSLAIQQLKARKKDKASLWLAQWMLGLTSKSVQNVLRSDDGLDNYMIGFERALQQAAERCRADLGDLQMALGWIEDRNQRVELGWKDIIRLSTAIGCQTLTIRGSDKSMFGKLFERLILGSFLSVLGFERVERLSNTKTKNVFWLSDPSDTRESDATLLLRPGKLARFDIGFIGRGNPEISKDKLTRFAQVAQIAGTSHDSVTFIIVDRLPETTKTLQMARDVNAEIVQMSMQFWPRELAQKLGQRLGFRHPLSSMSDAKIKPYLQQRLASVPLQNFLSGVSTAQLQTEAIEVEDTESA